MLPLKLQWSEKFIKNRFIENTVSGQSLLYMGKFPLMDLGSNQQLA